MPALSDVQTLRTMVAARATSEDTWLILPRDPISSHEATRLTFREICEKASQFGNGLLRTGLVEKDRPSSSCLIIANSSAWRCWDASSQAPFQVCAHLPGSTRDLRRS